MSGNRSLDEFADAGADGGAADERSNERDGIGGRGDATTEPAADDGRSADRGSGDSVGVDDGAGGTVAAADANAAALEPPASTYVWNPGGGPCAGCGSTVETRWRDGDDLVCPDCKEW